MKITRTEQIWLLPNKTLSNLCHLSKNLYNQGNHIIKNVENGKWMRYGDLDLILKRKGTDPSENYKQLPISTSQQILRLLDKSWVSFF